MLAEAGILFLFCRVVSGIPAQGKNDMISCVVMFFIGGILTKSHDYGLFGHPPSFRKQRKKPPPSKGG